MYRSTMDETTLDDLVWWDGQLLAAGTGEEFGGPQFLRPHHFVALACSVHRCGATALTIPEHLHSYAARMQLWQCIGLPPPTKVNERNPGGKFHPLSRITSEASAQALADEMLAVFRASGTTDASTLNALSGALSEIFSNCFFHAEANAPLCGLACAQTWPAHNLAQVAVADIGIGIRASLSANTSYTARLEAENACAMATELFVTSKPPPVGRHSGYGLTLAKQLMERHGGNFLVMSEAEGFRATQHGSQDRTLPTARRGTIVVMEWDTRNPMDVLNVYRTWPKDGEDDAFF
jgi:anti-sigma regulatory factor (Ser/Thr protein kinase)